MPTNIIHDTAFNANELLVLGMIIGGTIAILLFPKRFTPLQLPFTLLIGVVFGMMFDHTVGLPPFDYYDVGDQSQYEWFDLLSYTMYMPFGYFFIYFAERLKIRGFPVIVYIIIWVVLAIAVEWVGVLVGIFHYKNGYKLLYSIPIYAFLQSLYLLLYRSIFARPKLLEPAAD